ncbi:hypothetical protein M409DRAFT_21959 [Zasmidium cellare ATCC 36951]|uniref:Uncharacterized protein n=1 Tax=Zasmidium cellare ATCC 36951 TaxID=1080233 RepID=A0A6A6CL93_ZASCE|nr:uncharacterized protein M409DRAFT_21959 [Zasmidium cellare ATCC 36951]KAF2167811.1 hypothetical protein M409DRAFT_21959 [Zasmidium cellare ATCC 36951]
MTFIPHVVTIMLYPPPRDATRTRAEAIIDRACLCFALCEVVHKLFLLYHLARHLLSSTRAGRALRTRLRSLPATLEPLLLPVWLRISALLAPVHSRVVVALAPYGVLAERVAPGLGAPLGWVRGVLVVEVWVWVHLVWIAGLVYCAPFFLLAWMVRKVLRSICRRGTSVQESATTTATTAASTPSPFRFLDLPPELRNRNYTSTSEIALKDTVRIVYDAARPYRMVLKRKTTLAILTDLLRLPGRKGDITRPRRLALPSTSRQIHNESSRLLFEDMRLDFAVCDSRSSIPAMNEFSDVFKDKLQFVRRLEMPLRVARTLLFEAADNNKGGAGRLGISLRRMSLAVNGSVARMGGLWQLWYSREVIPAERRRWEDVALAVPGQLFDVETELTGKWTLGWIDP